ncbi:ABC transporter permease [Arenimonas fontis]|uniref:ABC transporter permease n=1 Tax=Arenimonas fontis TaxID=2608255 RepID=A0A5B2Z960_9GAMM|nr:ABC transporter permease [Arenimonas fontis]KAA2284686.1 ABC transporter permease [Arenimonas fontis]
MSTNRSLPGQVRACLALLALLALLCWLAPPLLDLPDPHRPHWDTPSAAPSLQSGHWFGTDAIGRDVLARTLAGGRVSLTVGALATVMALLLGLAWGAVAGYAGGALERAMVRVLDVLSALPFLLIVILLLALFGRSAWLLLAAIGAYVWIDLARVVRAEAARLREAPFVLAARAAGARFDQVLRWHLLPQLLPLALVYLGLILPQAILVESFLGFLGLGLDEPAASWGTLLAEGSQELDTAPWTLLFPAAFLVATLAAFQFLGDGLRDWLDVRGAPA